MITSILNTVKKCLGITEDYTHFDADIIMYINSVFMILTQLGIGPEGGFSITSADETWDDYLSDGDEEKFQLVKTYIYLKVRLMFDPPSSSAVMESINNMIKEFEWRLNVAAETS